MKTKSRIATILTSLALGAAMVFVFQNCGAPGASSSPDGGSTVKAKADDVAQLTASVKALSAQDLSCGSDDDCQPLGLGAKACGGPTEYIVVSRHNASLNQILKMSDQLNTESALLNQQSGLVSDCRLLEPPIYHCVSSTCQ